MGGLSLKYVLFLVKHKVGPRAVSEAWRTDILDLPRHLFLFENGKGAEVGCRFPKAQTLTYLAYLGSLHFFKKLKAPR